ncbi:MAG: hypothetical protein AB7U38_13555 [Hyphomicrobiales bacterium]
MYMERAADFSGATEPGRIGQIAYQRAFLKAHELRAEAFRRTVSGMWRLARAGAAALWRRIDGGRAIRKAESELKALSDRSLRDIAVARGEISYLVRRKSPCGCR